MPTEDTLDASAPDASSHQESPRTSDDIMSHPKYQELEEKHAAARKGMDAANLKVKTLEERLSSIETQLRGPQTQEEHTESKEEQYVTREALELAKWELKMEKAISLAEQEYEAYKAQGYKPSDALRLAHLDKGISPAKSEQGRQAASAQAGASVDRSAEPEIPDQVKDDMKTWGYTAETYKKYRKQVEEMRRR